MPLWFQEVELIVYKFGLKLWSVNENYIKEAVRLYEEGVYHYIELYVKPNSYEKYIDLWKKLPISYVIHAPHSRDGMNLAKKEKEAANRFLIEEAQKFADTLSADKMIVHPGIEGDIKETARQLKNINDKRILIENKPYYALDANLVCNGTTPDEIKYIMDEARVGFCLDIGHAICSANAQKQKAEIFLNEFLLLQPAIFHLTDGDRQGVLDNHGHIGQSNYNFPALLSFLPAGAMITVETDKDSPEDLNDYEQDIKKLVVYARN